jgi:hypothetical protein
MVEWALAAVKETTQSLSQLRGITVKAAKRLLGPIPDVSVAAIPCKFAELSTVLVGQPFCVYKNNSYGWGAGIELAEPHKGTHKAKLCDGLACSSATDNAQMVGEILKRKTHERCRSARPYSTPNSKLS